MEFYGSDMKGIIADIRYVSGTLCNSEYWKSATVTILFCYNNYKITIFDVTTLVFALRGYW